ncbi:MAG: type I restriction endonuclease subunit R [Methanobrevibacter sp.]|nr:type I restriction endonuclease subunit R [Candidatus Methanovirga meridionalis]
MVTESENILEKSLIKQLEEKGYENIKINDEEQLKNNFKLQLEKYNNIELTDKEFKKILIHLESGTIFNKAVKLRDQYELIRDNEVTYIKFFNQKDFCKNNFQVSNQITLEGKYENRYDVTILINGLPLVQIELKKRGKGLKEAFNQIKRYQNHSYHGLFQYIQIFIISNGVDAKYFANNKEQNYGFTFFWKNKENKNINKLTDFVDDFLDPYKLSKFISKYMVLNQTTKSLMVLRAYQYYAVEAIVDRVLNTNLNGYIWHTTGSGKTLTSFKVSQILEQERDVDKIIFVVDRRDLDYQTTKEFNSFAEDSVDGTENTNSLIKQLNNKNKLIITTIQKLYKAISKREKSLAKSKDKKIVMIFDECHRSQFGNMHNKITSFFTNLQYFGFTGTPIFAENANKNRTTKDIFGEKLHDYVIKDAIHDQNVLGFSVEYRGNVALKSSSDKQVQDINRKEFLESEDRLEKIIDFIIEKHDAVTHNREFNGLFAVSSIDVLKKYYTIFKKKIEERKVDNPEYDLKIASIFSFDSNEDFEKNVDKKHSRETLDEIINDYNNMFGTKYSTKDNGFQAYYVDLAKRFKNKEIDILIVVNMFLTGFDSQLLNTLYVDKNLEYHGLLQAYSRTNRIYNDKKSHGNIICFRDLKEATDDSIKLFSNNFPIEDILMKSYKEYLSDFKETLTEFKMIVTSPETVDKELKDENQERNFVTAFGSLLRVLNRLKVFTEFEFNDLDIDEQEFTDFQSKYLEIYEKVKKNKEEIQKESILDDVEFEVDLIRKDDINVAYILNLLRELDPESTSFINDKKFILNLIESSYELRSKLDLIEEFINRILPEVYKKDIDEYFEEHVNKKREEEFKEMAKKDDLDENILKEFLDEYEYSGKMRTDKTKKYLIDKGIGLKERRELIKSLKNNIRDFTVKYDF